MKLKLLIALFLFSTFLSNAQSNLELANKYLAIRGELVFTFTANNTQEIKELSRVISFDHGQDRNPLTINAIANRKGFTRFLAFNLPFKVNIEANEPKNVVMFDPKIHKKGVSGKTNYTTLSFPLTAYPTYADYVAQMNEFVAVHPTIARLENRGTTPGSAAGAHDLLFIVLSDNVATDEAEPRLLYTSSMHGDEIAGYPSMLNLIDHLITAYNDAGNSDYGKAQSLINGAEIWINPLANPDGTYRTTNDNVNSAIRGNANAIDLNRNYPAPGTSAPAGGGSFQFETTTFMNLADSYHFVLAANFHGGEEVFNYPWDFTFDRPVDNEWWKLVGTEYALNAKADSPPTGYSSTGNNGVNDGADYFDFLKPSSLSTIVGVTHGADWYQIDGGRQDYMNFEKQCREVTIELSHEKTPNSPADGAINDDILDMWNYNKNAYIDYLLQGIYGFRGIVVDNITTNPIKAKITIIGRDDQPLSRNSWVETELPHGDFYRLIEAGSSYTILIEADCYTPVTIENRAIVNGFPTDLGTISLTPLAASAPSSLTETTITATTATLNWEDLSASSYDIQYGVKGTSTSTWSTTSSVTNSLAISGLTANTTYEYQVRSVCGATSSSYSSPSKEFTTSVVSYCVSNGSNAKVTGITFVSFNSISNNDTNTQNNNGYGDFTALSTDVDLENSYPLSVRVNTDGNKTVHAFVWIDFDRNGVFNTVEEQFDLGEATNTTDGETNVFPLSITIPSTATLGPTRMRVSAKFNFDPTSCEEAFNGEVEDYTINIIDSTLGIQDELLSTFNLYPNPTDIGEIKLTVPDEIQEFSIEISNVLGQTLLYDKAINQPSKIHTINTTEFKSGIYIITIATNLGRATKKIIIE